MPQGLPLVLNVLQMALQGFLAVEQTLPVVSAIVSAMQARLAAGQPEALTSGELTQLQALFTGADGIFAKHIAAAQAAGR